MEELMDIVLSDQTVELKALCLFPQCLSVKLFEMTNTKLIVRLQALNLKP